MIRKYLSIACALVLVLLCSAASALAQGPREGITVHGNWLIEVTNPDGTVVDRREFENALDGGEHVLVALLTGRKSMGPVDIYLSATSSITIQVPGRVQPIAADPMSPFDSGRILTTNVSDSGSAFAVFRGTATAVRTGTLNRVITLGWLCGPSVAPDQCGRGVNANSENWPYGFSAKDLTGQSGAPSPLVLQPQQDVKVTVTFSFTSPAGGN